MDLNFKSIIVAKVKCGAQYNTTHNGNVDNLFCDEVSSFVKSASEVFLYLSERYSLSQKLCYFSGSCFSQCF